MGNFINTNHPMGSQAKAPMLRSVFGLRQLSSGMQQLSCDVVFGSPRADCLGTGVCKISALGSLPKPSGATRNCQSAPGVLLPLEGGNGVSLVILREMMCIKLLRTQFRTGVLTLSEPCRLPNDIITALSLNFQELKPGSYRLEEANGFFRINFI
jgi:hypothetical protein